jgi:hypothetical protein
MAAIIASAEWRMDTSGPPAYGTHMVTGKHKVLPHLEIRRVASNFYTYSVHSGDPTAVHSEDSLESLEHCLTDAADSLGHYFPSVRVSLDGQDLGNYSVQRLQQNPVGLAAELLLKAHSPGHKLS